MKTFLFLIFLLVSTFCQAAIFSNRLTTNADNVIAPLVGYQQFVVVPSTNYLGTIPSGARTFGPWLGADYVQQAVNALFSPTNIFLTAGGSIKVVGDNYCPTTVLFSNSANSGIKTINLYAESYRSGALICATNPCIRVIGGLYLPGNGNIRNNSMFGMHDLTIASIPNQTTNLFEMVNGFDIFDIEFNHFGCWYNITNDGVGAGFSWPAGTGAGNLVVYIRGFYNGVCKFHYNNMIQMCAVDIGVDHLSSVWNFFNTCGNNCDAATFVNDWPDGPYASGCCYLVGGGTNNSNGDVASFHDYFWNNGGGFGILGITALTADSTQFEAMFTGQPLVSTTNFSSLVVNNPQVLNARNYDGLLWTINSDYTITTSTPNVGTLQNSRLGTSGTAYNTWIWQVKSNVTAQTYLTVGPPKIPNAVTLTGSPFTFSNATQNTLECYFNGATAYSITKNGASVFGSLASDAYFLLQPTNKCVITYTVAPTLSTNSF